MSSNAGVEVPEGTRFSHAYLDRGEPLEDSPRARIRMRSLVVSIDKLRTSTVVEDKLGIETVRTQEKLGGFDMQRAADYFTSTVTVQPDFSSAFSPKQRKSSH